MMILGGDSCLRVSFLFIVYSAEDKVCAGGHPSRTVRRGSALGNTNSSIVFCDPKINVKLEKKVEGQRRRGRIPHERGGYEDNADTGGMLKTPIFSPSNLLRTIRCTRGLRRSRNE